MIPQAHIAHWRTQVPWVSPENVEQDLVLSRLIADVARHPLLGAELVFRGGTCLHKLWLALSELQLDPAEIAACFETYRPHSWTPARATANLDHKLADSEFVSDLDQLLAQWPTGYTPQAGRDAAHTVIEAIEARHRT